MKSSLCLTLGLEKTSASVPVNSYDRFHLNTPNEVVCKNAEIDYKHKLGLNNI